MKYLFFLFCAISVNTFAQSELLKPKWEVTTSGWYSSSEKTPFWVISNQYGRNKNTKNNTIATIGLQASDSIGQLNFRYKIEGDARKTSSANTYWAQEAWAEISYKSIYLMGGRRVDVFGISDSLLSSGGSSWSANARPMPRLSIGTNDFIDIPFSNHTLSFRASLEHGWFEYNRYVRSPFLHHKNFYLRAVISKNYHVYWGIEHFAQWGGVSSDNKIGKLPSSFSDYIRVFTTQSGKSNNSALWTENANKLGNHLGGFHFGFDARFPSFILLLYQQSFFEDGSGIGFKRKNRVDGVWGVSLQLPKQTFINRIVYEYIHTAWQSGTFDGKNSVVGIGGLDNYYNNGIYQNGWTYYGNTIGNPFISSPELLGNTYGTINNRVTAHYLSFAGAIARGLEYQTKLSFSRNLGLYYAPFPKAKDQFSFLLELMKTLPLKYKIKAGLQFAADRGDLLQKQYAIGFCVRANGLFCK